MVVRNCTQPAFLIISLQVKIDLQTKKRYNHMLFHIEIQQDTKSKGKKSVEEAN